METKKRSLVKAVSWRIIALIVLALISFFFTRNLAEMTLITLVYSLLQFLLYFIHERIWVNIRWGRESHPLSDIDVTKKLEPDDRKEIEKKLRDLGYM